MKPLDVFAKEIQELYDMNVISNEYDEVFKEYGIKYEKHVVDDNDKYGIIYKWPDTINYSNGMLYIHYKRGEPII